MSENERKALAEIIAKLDELEGLYRAATAPFQQELQQASGLSADLLRQSREALDGLQQPSGEKKLFATTASKSEQTATDVCPQCSGALETHTSVEPASQRGHVMIVTHSTCRSCDYHDQDVVSLPKEIALQHYNLQAFMNGA